MLDVYSIISNGILLSDGSMNIPFDLTGYITISVIEEILDIDDNVVASGGNISGYSFPETEWKNYKKRIRIRAVVGDSVYEDEVEVKDINLSVKGIVIDNKILYIEVSNPSIKDSDTKLKLNIQI
jgi:hypothetical protein